MVLQIQTLAFGNQMGNGPINHTLNVCSTIRLTGISHIGVHHCDLLTYRLIVHSENTCRLAVYRKGDVGEIRKAKIANR